MHSLSWFVRGNSQKIFAIVALPVANNFNFSLQ